MYSHDTITAVSGLFEVPTLCLSSYTNQILRIDQENLNAQSTKSRSGSPATKKSKNTPDITATLLEEQALKEIGETNWVGKLFGWFPVTRHVHLTTIDFNNIQNTTKEKPSIQLQSIQRFEFPSKGSATL